MASVYVKRLNGLVIQNIRANVFQEVFGQVHVVFQVIESNFRFDHPKL
ncbi:MAG: hypothetical protein RLZZ30_1836, partial [Bacteroidota bacterium]